MIIIPKGWGREEIWADEPGYCGKNMVFEAGKRFSMHFHRTKMRRGSCKAASHPSLDRHDRCL